ncbi:MAG: hypothetical protein ACE148_12145 [Vicinamibacterales bacterium]
MLFQPATQPVTPVIVRVVPPPTPEMGVMDVLVQAVGLTGAILLGSAILGALLGAAFIWYHRRRSPFRSSEGPGGAYGFDLSPR